MRAPITSLGSTAPRRPIAVSPPIATLLALPLLAAPGCALSRTQAEIKFLETRELRSPYAVAYDGALNAIFSLGMTIEHSDKASGVITGQSGDYALRAHMTKKEQKKNPVKKVTLLLRPRGRKVTQIRMKVLVNEEQQLDRKLMTALWQRIAREVMLDEGPSSRRASRGR